MLVGTPARNQWVVTPENTVRSIKRKMGSGERVSMAGQNYTPQELSAFILKAIKAAAEQELGQPVQRAVITVPAYFNEVQRQATLEAGEIAGLVVERILNEPTAAALAYGYGVGEDAHLRVLVYDLGGGTFDVSIIELNYGVVDVLATAGDNHLGGDDFDERLAAEIADEFEGKHKIDLRQHHQAWARLQRAAEEAKIALSASPYATLNLEYIAADRKGKALHIQREVTREEFVALIDDLLHAPSPASTRPCATPRSSRARSTACCWWAAPRASRQFGSWWRTGCSRTRTRRSTQTPPWRWVQLCKPPSLPGRRSTPFWST